MMDAWRTATGLYPFRQWQRVQSQGTAEMAGRTWREDEVHLKPGSPWENGYNESFNGKLHDEFLNLEVFSTLKKAQVFTEDWRIQYNYERPHSALGGRPPCGRRRPPAENANFNFSHPTTNLRDGMN